MKRTISKWISMSCCIALTGWMAASCSMMHQDLDDCPTGLYLTFRYDYNLERADMFNDHVGDVTVYVYDEEGSFVTRQTETNTDGFQPLKSPVYTMHLNLPEGRYQYLVLAGQKDYEESLKGGGANFVRTEPVSGDAMNKLEVNLDRVPAAADGWFVVPHEGLALDTLWHGMNLTPVEVSEMKPTYDTVSLVRDTKQINVTLRELDDPTRMDIADYDMKILDRNARILWNNEVDETDALIYTPYKTWNTDDRLPASKADGETAEGVGRIGHADFMTSRILWHDDPAEDAVLSVTNRETGVEVIRINLADMLARMRVSDDIHRYSPQEFLDRGYDYRLTFFLKGDTWEYLELRIDVLSWAMRIQNVSL